MRHEAAFGRKATIWEDVGIGVAVFALTAAIVIGVALWTQYVSAMFFVLATAFLAWHSGFRAALVTSVLSAIAVTPLTQTLDANVSSINLQVRALSLSVVCLVVSWLCGNLYRSR